MHLTSQSAPIHVPSTIFHPNGPHRTEVAYVIGIMRAHVICAENVMEATHNTPKKWPYSLLFPLQILTNTNPSSPPGTYDEPQYNGYLETQPVVD